MRLLIVSNMAHYLGDDQVVGWGPAVEEINHLATIFDEIIHIACIHSAKAPPTALPYSSNRVRLIPVPPSGGNEWGEKINILKLMPLYTRTMLRELQKADVIHVRCPANISMLAIVLLALAPVPKMRWVKYAGTWRPNWREPWSFKFQRWWLNKGLHRGVVTVNGNWPGQAKHIHSFLNPCIAEKQACEARIQGIQKTLKSPIQLVYVGQLNEEKGVGRVLQIAAELRKLGMDILLDIVGGGQRRGEYEKLSAKLSISDIVNFRGWIPHPALEPFYSKAHFILLPSHHEGWPKVVSEGMVHGAVPIASAVGGVPQILESIGSGVALDPYDVSGFVNAIVNYDRDPEKWKSESIAGIQAALQFTYEHYGRRVQHMLNSAWPLQWQEVQ